MMCLVVFLRLLLLFMSSSISLLYITPHSNLCLHVCDEEKGERKGERKGREKEEEEEAEKGERRDEAGRKIAQHHIISLFLFIFSSFLSLFSSPLRCSSSVVPHGGSLG